MDLEASLERLRRALAATPPATSAAIALDQYPGLKVTRAPAAASEELSEAVEAACTAAGWPDCDEAIPLAGELSAAQRALAEVLAGATGVPLHAWAIPQAAWARRRWLGIDPPGVLDRDVEHSIRGELRRVPLWRALAGGAELFAGLSLTEQLEAYGDLALGAYRVDPPEHEFGALGDAGRVWAPAFADRLVALFAPDAAHEERGDHSVPPPELCQLVVRALVEAGIAIDERWDLLVPLDLDVLATLPAARRDQVLVVRLDDAFPSQAIHSGLDAIARFPSVALVQHLLMRADQCTGSLLCPPRRTMLQRLRDAVAGDAALAALVDARIAELPPLPALRCTSKIYPAGVEELTPGQRTMLEILGGDWDLEYVSAFAIADDAGAPLFEALLYLDEDGAVCRAGTTNSVAYISQMRLSWNIDEPTVEALHAILREPPPRRPSAS